MSAEAYRHFLRTSSAWAAQRKAVFKRDAYACAACGAEDRPLHVHHLRHGPRWGQEPLDALTSACSACHWLFHAHSAWPTG